MPEWLGDARLVSQLPEERQALLEVRSRCLVLPLRAGHRSQVAQENGDTVLLSQLLEDHQAFSEESARCPVIPVLAGQQSQAPEWPGGARLAP